MSTGPRSEHSDSSDRSPRVLIIGGAVAGSACGIRLRELNADVTIAEKVSFPRAKVCGCCIGPAGVRQLRKLGLEAELAAVSVATDRWRGYFDGRRVDLDLPAGVAVSREELDPLLVRAAIEKGCQFRCPCEASVVGSDGNQIYAKLSASGETTREPFDVVVLASGLRSGDAAGLLPWKREPHGPFGVFFYASSSNLEPGVISMACDDDGYVGLVRLNDGRVDVAAALSSGSAATTLGKPIERVLGILQRNVVDVQIDPLMAPMTTPPLRRTRQAGQGRLLAIGDAAGYVEPFTGEGMTWALESGTAAAELIIESRNADRGNALARVGELWIDRSRSLLGRKQRMCRVLTKTLRSATARAFAAHTLGRFPALATPLLAELSRESTR